MGNVVTSEALKMEADSGSGLILVAAYAATQAASVAHAYDPAAPTILRRSNTPEVYADYPPTHTPYFGGFGRAAGRLINVFNQEDYALGSGWQTNQALKPDDGYDHLASLGFVRVISSGTRTTPPQYVQLTFPNDRGEIFSSVAEARSQALGRVPQIQGMAPVNLQAWPKPYGFTQDSRDHSGQFRSHIMRRAIYWRELLGQFFSFNP